MVLPLVRLPHVRWLVCMLWASLTMLVFAFVDAPSLRTWLALALTGLIPPVILLRLWGDGPPPTVAEVLHATELRR